MAVDARISTACLYRRAFAALMLAAMAVAPVARAGSADYCADSFSALQDALQRARTSPLNIQVVQGTYHIGTSGSGIPIAAGANLRGGYTAGCAGRDIELGNTVIVGDFDLHPRGNLTIEGMTWHGGLTIYHDEDLDDPSVPDGSEIAIRRSAFVGDAEGGGIDVEWIADDDGATVRIVDSVVAGNSLATTASGISLYAANDESLSFELVNDTIVDNLQGDGVNAQISSSGALLYIDNTIIYGNSQGSHHDLVVDSPFFSLIDDDVGTHSYPSPIIPPIGLTGVDPKLDAQYRPIESPPSPVINTGSSDVRGGLPSTDLPGRARVIGTAPDRGAFESGVDDSFLQTVTNTNDSGAGSLRTAITGANAHGSGLITFDIGSGCGPHVITLQSPLPSVTVPLIVNGYTQAGALVNDLDRGTDAKFCVVLEAGGASVTKGLQIPTGAGDGVSLFAKGLAFSGFSEAAIALGSGSGSSIGGNRFGGSASGHALQPNGAGIRVDANAHDTQIGSDDPADRNIIGGSSDGSGILVFGSLSGSTPVGSHDNQIIGNLIGVDWSGGADGHYTSLANGARGIYLAGHDNEISGNFIGANAQAGIYVANGGARGNTIENNAIGFFAEGIDLGNGAAGVRLDGDAGDAPSANVIRYNAIGYNVGPGVWIGIGRQNRTRQNQIFANGGLGIDLDVAGIQANDNDGAAPPADYANRGQNYPTLSNALGGGDTGRFTGLLESSLGDYRIDFYGTRGGCPVDDNRQAEYFIGTVSVSITKAAIGGNGAASIGAYLHSKDAPLRAGDGIMATATDGSGDTSELSACIVYQDDVIFANGFEFAF
ncbi:hypothetical protein FHW12_003276 [Dokdonella fugitiva]|uniref:Right handed beta helix domain-containing protein n=1 Tax=Dokdonella fugitiva TaxID=328517 RepID=A0A839F7J6_9GAMM|nr:right-handed parallel beta-helix repeat-containing protein [Dokdonella fugitiva]MBA8889040.1 hypothetical protein [Dokdonella fugitiva]